MTRINSDTHKKYPQYVVDEVHDLRNGLPFFMPQKMSYIGEYDGEAVYEYVPLEDLHGRPVLCVSEHLAVRACEVHARGLPTRRVWESKIPAPKKKAKV